MARSWKVFVPTYSPATYTRMGIESLSDEELAREYSRVRREATERLRSFARSKDPTLRVSSLYLEKKNLYLNKKQIQEAGGGRAMMEDLLLDAMRFIENRRSTVTGWRAADRKISQGLQAAGYKVQQKDLQSFGKFMDWARARKDAKTFGYTKGKKRGNGQIAHAFDIAKSQKISRSELQKHYAYYMRQVVAGKNHFDKWSKENAKKWPAPKK